MTNPFEQADGVYVVLKNSEGQHSLWPVFLETPAGWDVVFGEECREQCLEYIQAQWTTLQPDSIKTEAEPALGQR